MTDTVEADETYMGGKESNTHADKKAYDGRGPAGKQAVMGLRQRNGKTKGFVVSNTTAHTLQNTISATGVQGATVYTDDYGSYKGLQGYNRGVVIHKKQYVDGAAHANGIKSFWALLKRGSCGIHHHMSVKHLQKYVNEFAERVNNRKCDTVVQMETIAQGMNNKTLPYKRLTA